MKKVFAIRDNKVSSYSYPFHAENDIQACRSLQMAMRDDTIQISHFPSDFDLYYLGEFDEVSGKFIQTDLPKFIIGASAFIPKPIDSKPD